MDAEQTHAHAKRAEGMVRPDEVAMITLASSFFGKLPVSVQKSMMANSAKKTPYMGFVVEPYSFFSCHEITDLERAQQLLPAGYRIVPTRIFEDDEPRPYLIFGAFNVHTTAFWGSRVEMYVIAEHEQTGLLSWIIADYDTDTISYDPGQGFVPAKTRRSVVTTTHLGRVLVDMDGTAPPRRIALEADLEAGVQTPLDQRLWIEGNLSIAYGGELDDGESEPFGLIFDPAEMRQALRIPVEHVRVDELSWHPGLYAAEPAEIVCFPFAQHFITSSVPTASPVRDGEGLERAVAELNAAPPVQGFSTESLRRSILIGWSVSTAITLSLVLWMVLHFVLKH